MRQWETHTHIHLEAHSHVDSPLVMVYVPPDCRWGAAMLAAVQLGHVTNVV